MINRNQPLLSWEVQPGFDRSHYIPGTVRENGAVGVLLELDLLPRSKVYLLELWRSRTSILL